MSPSSWGSSVLSGSVGVSQAGPRAHCLPGSPAALAASVPAGGCLGSWVLAHRMLPASGLGLREPVREGEVPRRHLCDCLRGDTQSHSALLSLVEKSHSPAHRHGEGVLQGCGHEEVLVSCEPAHQRTY